MDFDSIVRGFAFLGMLVEPCSNLWLVAVGTTDGVVRVKMLEEGRKVGFGK